MLPYEDPAECLASLQVLAERLNTAIGGAYPATRARTSYKKVGVLMIHWENDDIGVQSSQDQLASVFRTVYGYEVSRFVIPSGRSTQFAQRATRRALGDMMDELDSPNSLLIVQYSGHSGGNVNECLWR
jgi:hypothetical protein